MPDDQHQGEDRGQGDDEQRPTADRRLVLFPRGSQAIGDLLAPGHGSPKVTPLAGALLSPLGGRDHSPVAVMPRLRPMLATSGPIRGRIDEWSFEPKLDGWRALAIVAADGGLSVHTRTGRHVTEAIPALSGLAEQLGGSVVLDGELVAHNGTPPSFYRLGPRMAARHPAAMTVPVAFVAFDLLWYEGELLTRHPYAERRCRLEALALSGPTWCTAPAYPGLGVELLAACIDHGLEGVVAKRLDSRYRCGERSSDWVKVKTPEWRVNHAPHRHD